ncbi:MAG: hypothetical protein IJ065_01280 [Eubacterium sp.]|nr:hypothetical protein [Eubacterium sp.]
MDVGEILENLKSMAVRDEKLRKKLIATKDSANPVTEFCAISTEAGLPLYNMDLIAYGEESYAAMRRSTNGGGENSPLLRWEDDAYELFIAEIEKI